MKKNIVNCSLLATVLGAVLCTAQTYAQTNDTAQPEFPKVVVQPEDQIIAAGSNVTFTVTANNQDTFIWTRNGTVIDGATNSTLTVANVGVTDAGYYAAYAVKGTEAVPTRSAQLMVATALSGDQMTVYGMPVANSGSQGTCPGPYAGYVNFTKTVANGWGWKPDSNTTVHVACDNVRSDTKVVYTGKYGDSGCDQTCVTLPTTTPSPTYRFTIYFPNNVPQTNYPITLSGFLP